MAMIKNDVTDDMPISRIPGAGNSTLTDGGGVVVATGDDIL
jgi:hypothetical protein